MTEFVHQRGSVAELHALDPFGAGVDVVPQVWWCDPTDSALVLGSRQRHELVDQSLLSAAGLHLTRRRSGGGAVIVLFALSHFTLPIGWLGANAGQQALHLHVLFNLAVLLLCLGLVRWLDCSSSRRREMDM